MQLPEIPIKPDDIQALETMRVILRVLIWLLGIIVTGSCTLIRHFFLKYEKERQLRIENLQLENERLRNNRH